MALQILHAISEKVDGVPQAIKPAINGSVFRIKKNYHEIAGTDRSRKFFYSEAVQQDGRRTLVQRMAMLYFAAAFASRHSAEVLNNEFASWEAIRARHAGDPVIVRPGDIWDRTEECSAMLARANRAWGNFDIPETRQQLIKLRTTVDEMLGMVNVMPDFEGKEGR